MTETVVLNLLVLAVSGLTSVLVGLVFRQLGAVARDVKEIRDQVGEHGERLATVEARIVALEKHGCEQRQACLRAMTE